MFLHFLTEDAEKSFFLKVAYLLAVAENEDDFESIPTRAFSDDPEKGEYAFGEFAPDFPMQISELLMLRKFAEEMGTTWDPVSSYHSWRSITCEAVGIASLIVARPAFSLFLDVPATKSPDAVEMIACKDSVAEMLKLATEELGNTASRSAVLKLVLAAIFLQYNAATFSIEKKKAMLVEATAMAYADGTASDHEQELLVAFCEFSHLDKELLEEFKEITNAISKLYLKSIELIAE